MPTLLHETLVMLFQRRPRLAPELIREALDQPLPMFDEVTLQDANLSQIMPTEFRADLVVLLRSGHPVYGIVVEIQLRRDADKEYSWPVYVTALRARYHCPCRLLVVTPDRAVARWAARPIELSPPGDIVTPLVIGPDAIPVITDTEEARERPELALLSVQAHGKTELGFEVGRAALLAADGLEDDRRMLYCELVRWAVHEAAHRQMEDLMRLADIGIRNEEMRKYFDRGMAEGEAKALLRILAARGLEVTESQRTQILQCTDPDTLGRWLDRAVTVRLTDELFH
jgi:hypothetical protein